MTRSSTTRSIAVVVFPVDLERLQPVCGNRHIVPAFLQQLAAEFLHGRLVVNEQHTMFPTPSDDGRSLRRSSRPGSSWIAGRKTLKVEPTPSALSSMIAPWWLRTILYTMDKPSPVPMPRSFVVKNGSKILSRIFSGIPTPVSDTFSSTHRLPGAANKMRSSRPSR